MKKIDSKTKEYIETTLAKLEGKEPYEIIYADPRDEEIQLKFLKRAQINAHMARWFLDHEYNQLLWSDGIFEILEIDHKKSGASFSNFIEVVHPEDRIIKNQANNDLKTNTKPFEINYRLLFSDGRIKWINEICTTDFDQDGDPIRSYGTIQDITKYKLAEESFRQKEEQFNSLIESIPLFIGIIQNSKFESLNSAGSRMLGEKDQHRLKGMKTDEIIPKKSRKNFDEKIKSIMSGQIETTFNEKMLRFDGQEFDANVKLIKTTHNGLPAIQILVTDITSIRETEETLRKSQEKYLQLTENLSANETRLKELVETKDKFFSIIAHDLRSPFNSMIGVLELLTNEYEGFSDSERKKYISLIENDAKRTLTLLDDLLDWAKLQIGKMSFQPQTQKLRPIVESVILNLSSAIDLKKLALSYSIPEKFEIYADIKMIAAVFQNLIGNAIKYSRPNGIITIEANTAGNQTEISVIDNGIGMSEDDKDKLFRIDQQITTPGTANEKGSGLGLILCKDFIKTHKGEIWVESEIGIGSKFIFRIPLKDNKHIN